MDKFVTIKKKTPIPAPQFQTIINRDGAVVELCKKFFTAEEAELIFKELQSSPHWNFDITLTKGGLKQTHRHVMLMSSMSDDDSKEKNTNTNTYASIRTNTGTEERNCYLFTPLLQKAKEKIEAQTGMTYNFAYLNLYRDGEDHISWHADNEEKVGFPIVSLSLGESRDFILRHIVDTRLAQELEDPSLKREALENAKLKVQLDSGDVLIMKGRTQQVYQHQVPPRVNSKHPRINITFRIR